jgi:BirA family biotin operon repressor/biotin-[acetyl-CoA-carboxylase] ligase
LIVNDKKLGGVLCDGSFLGERLEYVVTGIGINVHQKEPDLPSELRGVATSLHIEGKRSFDLLQLASCVVERIEIGWEHCCRRPEAVLKQWRELSIAETGSKVRVQTLKGEQFLATTGGLEDDGGLRIRDERGVVGVLRPEQIDYVRFLS